MTALRRSRLLHELVDRGGPTLGVMAAAGLTLAVGACGSSRHTTRTVIVPAVTASASSGPPTSVTNGQVHATLVGESHKPVVRKNWTYTVTASDPQGHPLSGTVTTEFTFQGAVIGKANPPTHRLKHGLLNDVLQFPADTAGNPLNLQLVVRTPSGSATLRWPVTVQK